MRRIIALAAAALVFALSPAVAIAEKAPAHAEMRQRLFEALKNAPTEAAGRAVESAIWESWLAAGPTEAVRADVKAAMKARDNYDYDKAMELLDGVIDDAPDYAEGWNQRAFIHFLREQFDESLADLDKALALEPNHFGALAGKAVILMRQGRVQLGQKVLRQAVEIHPWLKERSMLIPLPGEMNIPPGGKDI